MMMDNLPALASWCR